MDETQRAAFCATQYRFDSPSGELLLAVDEPNPALAALLKSCSADCMAVLTAFNPQALQRDDAQNRTAQNQLLRELGSAGHAVLQGRNEDPAGQWPVEESVLVPGISLAEARALAARHDQLAFLWADAATATPRLIETAATSRRL